jgi:glycosyltransferase involved in cell wall biosynthesis
MLAGALVDKGVDCRLAFGWRGPLAHEAAADGVPLLFGAGRHVPSRARARVPAMLAAASSGRFDVVHVSSIEQRCRWTGLAALRRGIPTVAHLRNNQQIDRAAELHRAGAFVVTNSRGTEAELRSMGATSIAFVPNGLDPQWAASIDRAAVRRAIGVPSDATMVLVVANTTPYKALDLAFPALMSAQRADPRLWIVHVGEVVFRSMQGYGGAVDAVIDASDTRDRVLRLGSRDDVASLTAAADIAFVPSHGEGTARTILEAWASEIPVIAGDADGLRDLVEHGETGLLVSLADESATAAAVVELASDRPARSRLARAGRVTLETRYTHVHHVDRLVEIYERLTGKTRAVV